MGYVGKHGVEALQKYKYSGLDLSLTSKYLFQPFWSRFVLIFPLWVAPNLVTLMGFGFITASCVISYVYSPDLKAPAPRWIYLIHGLFLFLYQTFDAVDGKQARRTGSSSPLGELFDHGCDALACSLEALTFASVLLHGRKVIWAWILATAAFYFATWETFFTHTLLLNVVNGPTEGLLMMYLADFWTAWVGPHWWLQDFREAFYLPRNMFPFIPETPMNEFCVWAFVPCLILTVLATMNNVQRACKERKERLPPQSPFSLVLPYLVLVGLHLTWMYTSPTRVMERYPFLSIIGIGFAFALLVGRLILAHLCDEYDGLTGALWMPLFVMPLGVANAVVGRELNGIPFVDEFWILLAQALYTVCLYAHFAHGVIRDICLARNIYCLRLGGRTSETKGKAE